jgi:TatA/E family protein of Tat protein translocase
MMGIGFPELMIILVIIMIIFGAGKLPEIGSAFGRSIKNFKSSMKEAEAEDGPATEAAPDEVEAGATSQPLQILKPLKRRRRKRKKLSMRRLWRSKRTASERFGLRMTDWFSNKMYSLNQ